MSVLYDLTSVSFAYPGRSPSLVEVTLRILAGEHLVLLGSNGAGKSTLLHILAGLLAPTAGTVTFEGIPFDPHSLEHDKEFRKGFRKRVGVLFQNSDTQLFCPSVREEVAFGPLQVWDRHEAVERTHSILRSLCIDHLTDEAPYALSGGEKRRVALATILVMEPDVFLLDEPTSNLDPKSCDFLYDVLEEFADSPGKTIIAATHNLDAAKAFSRTCAVITPEHTIALHAETSLVLGDTELLQQVNLISARQGREQKFRSGL